MSLELDTRKLTPEAKEKYKEFLDKYGLYGEWDGGNDSGGIDECRTQIPVPKGEEDYSDAIQDYIYDQTLGPHYGGWAWNFSASGTIHYDKETSRIVVKGEHEDMENLTTVDTVMFDLEDYLTQDELDRIDSVSVNITSSGDSGFR